MSEHIFRVEPQSIGGLEQVHRALSLWAGSSPLNLLVGEPWFGPPESLRLFYSQEVLNGDASRYSPPGGYPEMKQALAKQSDISNASEEMITVGNGSKSLLYGLCSAIKPKVAVVSAPAYPGHFNQLLLEEAEVYAIDTRDSHGVITEESLEQVPLSPDMVVISSPANPHGATYTEDQLRGLAGWCKENECILIIDEVYRDIRYDSEKKPPFSVDDLNHVCIIRSISKSLGACGWRFGWAITSPELARKLTAWQKNALNPPSTPIQRALIKYLAESNFNCSHLQELKESSRALAELFDSISWKSELPAGGFYLYVYPDKQTLDYFLGDTTRLACALAEEQGIALWPGKDFLDDRGMRVSFGSVDPANRDVVLEFLHRGLSQFLCKIPG